MARTTTTVRNRGFSFLLFWKHILYLYSFNAYESVPRVLNGDLREWMESKASGASTDVSEGIERVVVAVRAKFDAIVAVST